MSFVLCNCSAVKIRWHLRNLRAILYEISRISKGHTLETMGTVVNGHSGDSVIDEMRCILCDGRIIYKGPPDICIEDSYRQHLCKSNIYKPNLTLAQIVKYQWKLILSLVQASFFFNFQQESTILLVTAICQIGNGWINLFSLHLIVGMSAIPMKDLNLQCLLGRKV